MSTPSSTSPSNRASEPVQADGLLDTSVVIAAEYFAVYRQSKRLPDFPTVSAITFAELSCGAPAAKTAEERARRQELLMRTKALFDALPFDADAARAYARVYAATLDAGRKPRGGRTTDLLIAAVALANDLPLYTCNEADFAHLRGLIDVVAVA